MARAPFQVLVIPFRHQPNGQIRYAILQRSDNLMWQFIAGGGEDDEKPSAAAVREAREEANIPDDVSWISLNSVAPVPRSAFPGNSHWPSDFKFVPEFCFAVDMTGRDIVLSAEHDSYEWLDYDDACNRLTWPSNQIALRELQSRLGRTRDTDHPY